MIGSCTLAFRWVARAAGLSRVARAAGLCRVIGCIAVLAALAACSTNSAQGPAIDQSREAAVYQARARGNYHPPGPDADPWGPYVIEASRKFDVPERWIREVMHVESGGHLYQSGALITSRAGAMGLMQVMPETYDELRVRYDLSEDAYDPHNNVLAGTAYLREMYDIYGSPGFLAAYNAGPKRLDDYLANVRSLPDETRRYVAMIGPNILDAYPINRSPAERYAMNDLPLDIPPGLRDGSRAVQVAEARPTSSRARRTASRSSSRAATRLAKAAPTPDRRNPHRGGRFSLVQPAVAETVPSRHGGGSGGDWAVQVGAYANPAQARSMAGMARQKAGEAGSRSAVATVQHGKSTLYRARLNGLSRESAVDACRKLAHSTGGCMVLSPNSQS